jgi:hypothetical protein
MELDEEQSEMMDNLVKVIFEYQDMNRDNNSAITDAKNNFYEKVCPKPSGKMNEKDKEFFKETRAELKNFVADSLTIEKRKRDSKPETTYDALKYTSRKDK